MNSNVTDEAEDIDVEDYYKNRLFTYIEKKQSINEFCANYIPKSITPKYFKQASFGHPQPGNDITPYPLERVYKLTRLGIPPELLLLHEKHLLKFKENYPDYDNLDQKSLAEKEDLKYFVSLNQLSSQNDSLLDFQLVLNDDPNSVDKLTNYYTKYISEASMDLVVEEFLGKGNNKTRKTTIPSYKEASDKIFRHIEKRVASKKLQNYTRLFALPPDPLIFGETTTLKRQYPSLALLCASNEVFHHICRCFTELDQNQYNFYAKPSTSFVQFHLIDSKYLLLETYLYNVNTSEPNFLMAYRNAPNTARNKMFQLYANQVTKFSIEQERITKANLCYILKGVEEYLKIMTDKIEQLKPDETGGQNDDFNYIAAVFSNYSFSIVTKIRLVQDKFPSLLPSLGFFKK